MEYTGQQVTGVEQVFVTEMVAKLPNPGPALRIVWLGFVGESSDQDIANLVVRLGSNKTSHNSPAFAQ